MARKGIKTPGSGRKKGTPNKATLRAQEIFEKHPDFDPLEALIEEYRFCQGQITGALKLLAEEEGLTAKQIFNLEENIRIGTSQRTQILKELAPYRHPKLSIQQLTGDPDKPLIGKIIVGLTDA